MTYGPGWVNVRDWGAQGSYDPTDDAGTARFDDTAAFAAAFDALPANGGILHVPRCLTGKYYLVTAPLAGKTGSIDLRGKPVRLQGEGGDYQQGSVAPFVGAAPSRIISKANAPVVVFTEKDKTATPSQHSGMADIAIEGRNAGAGQHGVVVDNRGGMFLRCMVGGVGGDCWRIVDSVGGLYQHCSGFRGVGAGFRLNESLATGANPAVSANVFVACQANACSVGWHLESTVWSNVWYGGIVESNTTYGIRLLAGAARSPSYNMFIGIHDEGNTTASIRLAPGAGNIGVKGNFVWFSRYFSPQPVFDDAAAGFRNVVWGSDLNNQDTDAGLIRLYLPVVPTANLPAAGAAQDGRIVIEDPGGGGTPKLMIYGAGLRTRITGTNVP